LALGAAWDRQGTPAVGLARVAQGARVVALVERALMPDHATMTCDGFIDLGAAVALDALEPDPYRRVEEHAAACPECARHLSDFRQVAAALGSAVRQIDPPATLRRRVFDAVAHTRQERRGP